MAGRILVLDDEENYAEMLQELLLENNYRADMATRPERAIEQLEEIPYDLVISDFKMPVMDGAGFLKKSRELYPNLPFILVSGLMNTPELAKVANMNVTFVMEKPLDTEVFLRQVARFSQPMTEEEKSTYAGDTEEQSPGDGVSAYSYPEEPRFFSTVSALAKRFMQNAWSIAEGAKELFILDPLGADAELAIKDISAWRGNSDLPVATFNLPDSKEERIEELKKIVSETEQSDTICIRLTEASQIPEARELTAWAIQEVGNVANMLLVYVLESKKEVASSLRKAGAQGIVIPGLCERPSDLASYALRFARMASERSGKKNCSEFTPEAAYAILAYGWPRGYREVQEVVMKAAMSNEIDEAISAELIQSALEGETVQMPVPDSRLIALMEKAQKHFFEQAMLASGMTAAELARELALKGSIQNQEDLLNKPLLEEELAQL